MNRQQPKQFSAYYKLVTSLQICFFIFMMCIICSSELLYAQETKLNKADLENERHKYQKKIADAIRLLENNDHNQKESMSKLQGLDKQLNLRKGLVENLQHEVLIYEEQIKDIESVIVRKQKELEQFTKEYSKIVVAHAQQEKTWARSVLVMYFSASSWSELLSRRDYFKQYTQSRRKEMKNIVRATDALKKQQQDLIKLKAVKDDLLNEENKQNQALEESKEAYNNTIDKLKHHAKNLKVAIENSKKSIAAIDKIVLENIEKTKNTYNESAKTHDAKSPIEVEIAPKGSERVVRNEKNKGIIKDGNVIFSSFEKAKGFLQLPVDDGIITGKFGNYQHPIYPKVILDNHGIDIRTKNGAKVFAVFGGEVIAINKIPGSGILVMVQHSKEYYTVYAKLKSVKVKIGSRIAINEQIGVVELNVDKVSELQFQIWKGTLKLDPETWIKQ